MVVVTDLPSVRVAMEIPLQKAYCALRFSPIGNNCRTPFPKNSEELIKSRKAPDIERYNRVRCLCAQKMHFRHSASERFNAGVENVERAL